MAYIDYYKILDLKKDATADDIKKAYRKLARKYHPDLNANNEQAKVKFQQINEANEVLSDPEKRQKYDQHGHDWLNADKFRNQRRQQHSRNRGSDYDSFSGGFGGGDFSDFFSSMFGGGGRSGKSSPFKGQDYTSEIRLTLTEIYTTHKQTLTINGKQVRITIPAGVENGQKIKLAGYGAPGPNNGPPGDLYITFHVTEHPKFKRKGNDIYLTEEINVYTAILGGEKIVHTLNGKVKLNVSAGTQPDTSLRLKGKGLPVYKKDSQFGDLYIKWLIKLPVQLSAEQKDLFEKLAKL